MIFKDYYKILGLDTNRVTDSEIKIAFRDQAKKACQIISQDPNYSGDFAIVSISQGGVLSRYVIEKCEMPGHVKVFVSIGGPLAGTHQIPHCLRGVTCHILNSFVDWFVYKDYVQETMGPSGYFRVSNHLSKFRKSDSLLLEELEVKYWFLFSKSISRISELSKLSLLFIKGFK